MPVHTFRLNGKRVRVEAPDSERLLWVLRDRLGVTGPKYGCGINVCKACTCHINGSAFNPCSVPVSQIKRGDEITTIEGLGETVGRELHPMQEAWIKFDVAQCGFCQPGQIMSAVSRVNEVRRKTGRRRITDGDIEQIRNICRCGTYPRIRDAIRLAAESMPKPKRRRRPRRRLTKAQRRRRRLRRQRRRRTRTRREQRRRGPGSEQYRRDRPAARRRKRDADAGARRRRRNQARRGRRRTTGSVPEVSAPPTTARTGPSAASEPAVIPGTRPAPAG